jgi:hypothetical protein
MAWLWLLGWDPGTVPWENQLVGRWAGDQMVDEGDHQVREAFVGIGDPAAIGPNCAGGREAVGGHRVEQCLFGREIS